MASCSDHFNSQVLGLKRNHGSDSLVVSRGVNRELQTSVNFSQFCFINFRLYWFGGFLGDKGPPAT